ncbi:MAG: KpsF/GutQ family sugar-phosphate isomerase [Desulfovibrionaceae bacterium]|jgi:arabinose-5-phosphate isomerase|nr:KpsF/GutQ family sugar-phosphate isomerase [Desulfovibrionaceae bacterium]
MNDERKSTWLALAREVLDIEIQGLVAVRDRLDGGFTAALDLLARCTGRVVLTGIGKSGLVGRKIAATLSSTGTPAFFLHPVEGAHGDMGMIRPEDVVVAISNSGETDELNAILPALRSLGAGLVALTGGANSTLAELADAVVDTSVPREACPMDLAPTASTTAVLAVGDALAVCLIRIKDFGEKDFKRFHPGGMLGQRLQARVGELMHEGAPCVEADATFADALRVLNAGGLGAVIVTRAGLLEGIVTDGDVRRLVCAGGFDSSRDVAHYMVAGPKAARVSHYAAQALDIMEAKAITVLPVVDESDAVVGVIHLHDLLGKGRLKFA